MVVQPQKPVILVLKVFHPQGSDVAQAVTSSLNNSFVTVASQPPNSGASVPPSVVFDRQTPILHLPNDIFVLISPGQTGTSVNYSASVTDNDPNVSLVCTPASGSFFLVGTTAVQCTATDTAQNVATGSFNVMVTTAYTGFLGPLSPYQPPPKSYNGGSSTPIVWKWTFRQRSRGQRRLETQDTFNGCECGVDL